jgi:uncharacterized membrane protein
MIGHFATDVAVIGTFVLSIITWVLLLYSVYTVRQFNKTIDKEAGDD